MNNPDRFGTGRYRQLVQFVRVEGTGCEVNADEDSPFTHAWPIKQSKASQSSGLCGDR
jgi:hypothetical protein